MAVKTFVPRIVHLLHHACLYITKHRAVIATYLSSTQLGYLDAVVVACNTFTGSVSAPIEEP